MEYNRTKERLCGCCQKPKDKQTFHSNPIKPGYMYMCKECCTTKFKDALAATGNDGAALWAVCMANDLPMVREIYEATIEQLKQVPMGAGRKPSLFLTYIALLKDCGKKYSGCYDSDMQLGDFIHIGTDDEIADAEKRDADIAEQRKVWAKTWGADYDDDDCAWLDDMFESYTGEIYEMDTGMEMRYRDLCKAELRKFEDGADKEISDEIFKLMKLLKIDQFKENKRSDTEKFIERMAWTIENTKPAECEDLEKYKDISGFESTWGHIMRCVKNLCAGTKEYPNIPRDEQ